MAKKRNLTTYILFGMFAGVLVGLVIAVTLAFFNIPEAGLLLIIGIDQFLDMGRSATNVIGNSIATSVVAKWEGKLGGRPAPFDPIAAAGPAG